MHIPKTGGTSIEVALCNANYERLLWNNRGPRLLLVSPQHYHNKILNQLNLIISGYKFTVVRDPIDRIISEGLYRKIRDIDAFIFFSLFVYRWFPRFLDNHIRPQSHFLIPGINIFKFEDGIDDVFKALHSMGFLQADIAVPHLKKNALMEKPIISAESASLIMRLYEEDYNRLGYQRPKISNFPQHAFMWRTGLFFRCINVAITLVLNRYFQCTGNT